MKHALVTLIIVILFVLIVVPLMHIAIGKLKNPIDIFALSKVGGTGMITQKSNFISPNYIPAARSAYDKKPASTDSYSKTQADVESCFTDEALIPLGEEFFSVVKKEGSKLNIRNDLTGTTRYFENFYPTVETEKSAGKKWDTISVSTSMFKSGCAKNGTNPTALLTAMNDGGTLMQRMIDGQKSVEDFDFTNKGITTINGLTYYWCLFEDKHRLVVPPGGEVFYLSFYSIIFNDKLYLSAFDGSSETFGSSRDFLNQNQVFLGGTVYGTSPPIEAASSTSASKGL